MLRYLFNRRWLGLFVLVVCLAVGCVLLSRWQWERRDQRLAANHLIETNHDQRPAELTELLPDPSTPMPQSLTWRPVRVTGHYLPEASLLVRNRPRDSTAGFYVLVPFTDRDGTVLLVNRGWVPAGDTGDRPDSVPPAPTGDLTLVARLLPPESDSDQQAPAGQTYRIVPAQLADELSTLSGGTIDDSTLVTGAYAQLDSEDPAPASAPVRMRAPELDEGPHLSYAIQWVIFAVGGFAGFLILVRRTMEDERADEAERAAAAGQTTGSDQPQQGQPAQSVRSTRRRTRHKPTDEEIEDAQIAASQGNPQRTESVEPAERSIAPRSSRNEHIG